MSTTTEPFSAPSLSTPATSAPSSVPATSTASVTSMPTSTATATKQIRRIGDGSRQGFKGPRSACAMYGRDITKAKNCRKQKAKKNKRTVDSNLSKQSLMTSIGHLFKALRGKSTSANKKAELNGVTSISVDVLILLTEIAYGSLELIGHKALSIRRVKSSRTFTPDELVSALQTITNGSPDSVKFIKETLSIAKSLVEEISIKNQRNEPHRPRNWTLNKLRAKGVYVARRAIKNMLVSQLGGRLRLSGKVDVYITCFINKLISDILIEGTLQAKERGNSSCRQGCNKGISLCSVRDVSKAIFMEDKFSNFPFLKCLISKSNNVAVQKSIGTFMALKGSIYNKYEKGTRKRKRRMSAKRCNPCEEKHHGSGSGSGRRDPEDDNYGGTLRKGSIYRRRPGKMDTREDWDPNRDFVIKDIDYGIRHGGRRKKKTQS
jgi:hypothetical protein